MAKSVRVIISGGGTGGHIFPAVSIANAIKDKMPTAEILFVGAEGRMEMEKVPAAGYSIIGLPIQGLYRSLTLKNIKVIAKAISSLKKAKKIIKDFKPDIAIGVGGYASGPLLWQASSMGIPTLIQEQNSYAGVTNKLLAKKASKICVAYQNMDRFFPAESIIYTGNPVRQNLLEGIDKKEEGYNKFNLDPAKRTILVVGGSLGARTLNESLLQGLEKITSDKDIQVIWQTGKFYIEEIKKSVAEMGINTDNLYISDFIPNMDLAYSIADLVVSRAGASSISELSLLKKACILVPSPNVSEDHQRKNAMALVEKDAAIMITDDKSREELVNSMLSLVKDEERLSSIREHITSFACPAAAEQIAIEVFKTIGITDPAIISKRKSATPQPKKAKKKESNKRYFFLGIGGIGMSAIARYFHKQGHLVAGYDLTKTPLTEKLEEEGINIHYKDNISLVPVKFMDRENTVVIYTPAVPDDMSEKVFFKEGNFTMLKRSEILGELTEGKKALCVAGTHGKTTTSTMLAHILNQRAEKVNAFLGGISKNYESNLIVSHADQVVVEADEYDRSFLRLKPSMAIITATDADHLDIYGTKEELLKTFAQFTSLIEENGVLVMKKGLEMVPDVKESVKVYEYSGTEKADFYAENILIENGELYFDFVGLGKRIEKVQLGVPVMINVENAVAAMAIAMLNGMSANTIKNAVQTFKGSVRRFDIKVKNERKVYIDDYAHHPEEIKACVDSIRSLYPDKRICGIFQPHLYSRTKDFASEFAESLSKLDDVIVLDIYPARELPIKGVTSNLIHKKIKGRKSVLCKKEECLEELKRHNFDVLITIGAGNIDQLVNPITEYVNKL
jgi:UDP-N-acetylmuramate--alanine ligase